MNFPNSVGDCRIGTIRKSRAVSYLGIGKAGIDFRVELVDDLGRRALWRADADQMRSPRSPERIRLRSEGPAALPSASPRHREGAQLASSDVPDRRRHKVELDLHLSTEQVCKPKPVAAKRHVDQIDAGHHLEQFAGQMRPFPVPAEPMLIFPGLP